MKQRIRIIGIVGDQNEGFLLLKKKRGRNESRTIWELPTGKINFGEQPEEAVSRMIYEQTGMMTEKVELLDVMTFVGIDEMEQINNLFIVFKIIVQDDSKIVPGDRYSAYKICKNFDNGNTEVSAITREIIRLIFQNSRIGSGRPKMVVNAATVYVDGSSRGNPGPSGIGYYIVDGNGLELARGGEFIGFATSRVAEYFALKEGCEQAIELGLQSVKFVSDNLMLVNQMNGVFRVKNNDIASIYDDIIGLLENFENYAFVHVKRNQNFQADREANEAIDRHFK